MEYRKFPQGYVLRLDPGEEIVDGLTRLARQEDIPLASVTGLGAATAVPVGIFTNLTQDHLDFHKTMEAYCDAKAILCRHCDRGVFNPDDPWTERLWQDAACTRFTYAEKAEADLRAEDVELGADHVAFTAVTKDGRVPVRVNIPAGFTFLVSRSR